jgi:hypothetical protein
MARATDLDHDAREIVWEAIEGAVDDAYELTGRVRRVCGAHPSDLQYAQDKLWRAFSRIGFALAILGAEHRTLLAELADQCDVGAAVAADTVRFIEEECAQRAE